MLETVVSTLRKQEGVDDWLARHVRKTSTQHYVIGSDPESEREVTSERVIVTVMNDHPSSSGDQGSVRGEAQVTLLPTDLQQLELKLADAVFMASLTDNPTYAPAGPAEYPAVELADPEMRNAPRLVAQRMVEQLTQAVDNEKGVRLSSAEVFVEESHIATETSRGARAQQIQTDLLLDFVLLAAGGDDEMEAQIAFKRRRAEDLDVPAMVRRQAQYARDALAAATPKTGTFPVVVSDDALQELLMSEGYSPLVLLSSGQLKYQQLTTWEASRSIHPQEPTGDPFTLYSNALLPFGTRSYSFDGDGLPGQRVPIIESGVLSRFRASNRYAQYLQIDATGQFGNMEIDTGSVPFASLLEDSGPLYHIVAFSAMGPDPITGDFVGEIRLGYEIEAGRARPIRGGSISGNLMAALATATLSQESTFLGDYLGPRAMRFPQITVAGS